MPCSIKNKSYADQLLEVAESVFAHPALDNDFYHRWMKGPLNAEQMRLFCVNYYHWIYPTVQRLTLALNEIGDLEARVDLIHNLYDEYGHGVSAKVHTKLLYQWLDCMHSRVVGETFDPQARPDLILPATKRLTEVSMKLCGAMGAQIASGAVLAQEWHAYTQFVKLYEGYRHYMKHFALDEFHDYAEYLYIHIGWAEKEHKKQTTHMAVRVCANDEEFARIKEGFSAFLDLLADFWRELDAAMAAQETEAVGLARAS